MDDYRAALDTTWDWAERRGVRVEFWRDGQEWHVDVVLSDTDGDFTGHTPLRLFRPSRGARGKFTQTQLRDAYSRDARKALDDAVVDARARRANWQSRRLH